MTRALPGWLWIGIAIAVTATWVVLNVIDALSTDYQVSELVHGVMGAVAGWGGVAGYLQEKERKRERSSD